MKIRLSYQKSASLFFSIFASLLSTESRAAALTWDFVGGDGAAITAGNGNWNTTAANTVWNNSGANVIWSQTSTTDGSNSAIFAGSDGTVDQYVITLGAQMAAESITFNSSGYRISGSTLALIVSPTTPISNGAITVAAAKTATINSILRYAHNTAASVSVGSGGTLNLSGGTTASNNPQFAFTGVGAVNMIAGTYGSNIGSIGTSSFNQTGGTYNITPGNGTGFNINSATQNVAYNLSSGTLTVNGNATVVNGVSNAHFGIGNGTSTFTSSLNVSGTGIMNVGTTAGTYGEIRIGNATASNGTFNVSGGTVTVGTGAIGNKIYFFKNGSSAGYTASMTQAAGTVTTNGIQFGSLTGTYDATSAANLTLSGGSLYVGDRGIIRGDGTAVESLPVTIKLQGGTLGASASWSSSIDMKLGTATIQAANSAGTAQTITLSGILSDDGGTGTVTKTGAGTLTLSGTSDNTFTGATTVSAGTLNLGKVNAVSNSSSLTIANGAGLALSTSSSTVPNLTFQGAGALNFNVADSHVLTVSNTDGVTNSGAAGSISINITGNAPANGTYTLISYSGALQGSGFSAYTLGNVPSGKSYTLQNSANAVQLFVASAYTWTGLQSSEWSMAIIAGSKNWSQDGNQADYANGLAVFFDSTATNKTVEITGADVTPQSVVFDSGDYILQGTNKIAGAAPLTIAADATLKLGSSNVLPDGLGSGNITVNGILDLNGNSDTINALIGTGWVENTLATTTSTLSVGAGVGGSFSGSLSSSIGTLALLKTGPTDFALIGNNTYDGATTIQQSRLFISNAAAFSPNTEVTVHNEATFVLNSSGTPAFSQSILLNSGSNLSMRRAATLSNVTLPSVGSVKFNFDDVTTQALTLASNLSLGGNLNVQIGGGTGTPGAVTLTGILSGSGSLVKSGNGLLSLGGDSSFNGGVTIKHGTLEAKTSNNALGTGVLTMGGVDSTGATFITGRTIANAIIVSAPSSGSILIGANGNGSGYSLSGGITLNGNLTIQTFNNPVDPLNKATGGISGGITGAGNVLLNNNGLSANVFNITIASVNHLGSLTLQGTATGNTNIGAVIGSNVTAITQNSATSTMILSGANTYDCDLTVNVGTVRISNQSNTANDASTVRIADTGATLDLTYAGTDTVGKLIIGSIELASGVYGKVGSTSPVIGIPQITGDGTLTVGSSDVTFATWITGSFANGQVPAGKQGANDDADGDGISNLLEFAIEGQDPTVPNPTVGSSTGSTLSFNKRQNPAVMGVTYAIEESTDLGVADDWDEVTGPNYIKTLTTISYSYDTNVAPRNFLRLKVSQ